MQLISVQGGGRGVGDGSPLTLEKFSKLNPTQGKFFAFCWAKMLANNGFCVGQPPTIFLPALMIHLMHHSFHLILKLGVP